MLPNLTIKDSKDCAAIFRKIWEKLDWHERVYALYFNRKLEPIAYELLNIGDYCNTTFDTRSAVHYAFQHKSTFIAIAHNHPSGICKPSPNDLETTKLLQETLVTIYQFTPIDIFLKLNYNL